MSSVTVPGSIHTDFCDDISEALKQLNDRCFEAIRQQNVLSQQHPDAGIYPGPFIFFDHQIIRTTEEVPRYMAVCWFKPDPAAEISPLIDKAKEFYESILQPPCDHKAGFDEDMKCRSCGIEL